MKIKYAVNTAFYRALKEKIHPYFESRALEKTGTRALYVKAIIILSSFVALYALIIVCNDAPRWILLLLCAFLGINHALIGFNIMHDASHDSFSKDKKRNRQIVRVAEYLNGVSSFLWRIKHVTLHHSYVNTHMDEDIHIEPFLRVSPHQKYRPHYRFQIFYFLPLYALLHIIWVFVKDPIKYFSRKVHTHEITKIPLKEHFYFWLSKVSYIALYVCIPLFWFTWEEVLIGHLVMTGTCGVCISMVFQLAHINEKSTFYQPAQTERPDWAAMQVAETADFAITNTAVIWACGGLTHQTIHHLFPNISHVHYTKIQPLVAEVCKEFKMPYKAYTFWGALRSHIRTLQKLGRKPA